MLGEEPSMHHCLFAVHCWSLPSVLWRCWLGGRKGIRLIKKLEWWGVGVVICLERGADLHMAQLMPLPLTVSCFSKIQIGFTFLVPAHLSSPRKGSLNWCVCVCVLISANLRALLSWIFPTKFFFVNCFDAIGWASLRAYDSWQIGRGGAGMISCLDSRADCLHIAWPMLCCHPKTPSSSVLLESGIVLPFWCWLTQVVLQKRPLNGCFYFL